MSRSIAGLGAYVPRYRLPAAEVATNTTTGGPAGIERTAVTEADEDPLTMAYEAATLALDAAGVRADDIASVTLATTTPPLGEESAAARLASFLGTDGETAQFGGSTAAGVRALTTELDRTDGTRLVVASDAPVGEPESDLAVAAGAGGAAVVLDDDGPGSARATVGTNATYPGTRFRPRGERATREIGATAYERTAYVETIGEVVDRLNVDLESIDVVALQAPNGKLPYRACSRLDISTEAVSTGTVVHDVGDTGVASPLVGLASALDAGAESAVLVGYGSGSEGSGAVLDLAGVPVENRLEGTTTISYVDALRLRGETTPDGEPDGGGAYVSVPTWQRTLPQRHRLIVARCGRCGAVNLRPNGACRECHELPAYESVTLPGTGVVAASTEIQPGGAPPEFADQSTRGGSFVSAVISLDGPDVGHDSRGDPGSRVDRDSDADEGDRSLRVPMQVVGAPDSGVEIGDRIETTIRRVYTQEGLPRYGRKAIRRVDRR